jgi:[acyl-carrier-protein] S-malonyltransferase
MVAFIFPGQGAQYVGMGKGLYETFKESKVVFDKADEVLGFFLSRLCFEGPQEELTRTPNCQPAILTASIAALEAFKSAIRYPLSAIRYSAGLSLGEYSALVASGVLSFEDGLRLVRKRAELMEEAARVNPGKMAAIVGLERSVLEALCKKSNAELANINCPGQMVITGRTEAVEKAKNMALEKGAKRAIDLEVSGAFHSSLMREAALEFKAFLEGFNLKTGSIPVVSNVTAEPRYEAGEIRENLFKQIYSPVLWEDSVRYIAAQGVKTFYEIGPGNVLKGLLRKIDANLEVKSIGTVDDINSLQ